MSDEPLAARAPSGTHDVLWPESTRWESLVAAFADQVERAGYGLAHTPIFEDVRVFRRGIGEGSDVVGKEMYEFEDRGGRALALRPEGTAPLVRAFVQHRPPLPWKAWYVTPAFRYERPQAGRYRQHHQLGVEALGTADPDLDVEVVSLADGFFAVAGADRRSSSGSTPWATTCAVPPTSSCCRRTWPSAGTQLCPEHRRAAGGQPAAGPRLQAPRVPGRHRGRPPAGRPPVRTVPGALRPGVRRVSTPWGSPTASTTAWSGASTTTPAPPSSSPRTALESAQNGIGGGGRYDGLVEMLGGPPTPGIGFGIGIERLLLACDAEGVFGWTRPVPDAFVVDVTGGEAARDITAELRGAGLRADRAFDGRSMKSQLKSADRSGARVALIVGPDEVAAGTVSMRPMRGTGDQRSRAPFRGGGRGVASQPVGGEAAATCPACPRPRDRVPPPKGPV